MTAIIMLCLRWRCFTSWIRVQTMLRRRPCSPFRTLDSSSSPHLHDGFLVVNVLYFCTFIYQTSNLSNFNLLKAHWNLSCFCLLFILARMPSFLLLDTCLSFKTIYPMMDFHRGEDDHWLNLMSVLYSCCQSMQIECTLPMLFCFVFLLLFKLSGVRYL